MHDSATPKKTTEFDPETLERLRSAIERILTRSPEESYQTYQERKQRAKEEIERLFSPIEMPGEKSNLPLDSIKEVMKRFRVERWIAPAVELASPVLTVSNIRKLFVRVEELSIFEVQPYIRINLRKERSKANVSFMIERMMDPQHPGRYINPRKGTILVQIIRPKPKEAVKVHLGSQDLGYFVDSVKKKIPNYMDNEEQQWEAEVLIRLE